MTFISPGKLTGMLLFILFSLPYAGSAQNADEKAISQQVNRFFKATQEKNWDAVLDLTYPRLFELAPREQIRKLFTEMESEGMTFSFHDLEIEQISPVTVIGEEQFARIDYGSLMKIHLQGEEFEDASTIDLLQGSFEQSFGTGNVQYVPEENTFRVNSTKTMLAVARKTNNDWKFIEINPAQKDLMKNILPVEILDMF